MNVLIVDDEVIIRTGLASVISWSELGLHLLSPAASAEEALERLEAERPDILITDIRMNGKTGLELAEEAAKLLPGLEVIILSGYGDFAYTQQAIRQGVGDYLLKTSKPEEIIRTVLQAKQRLLERRAEDSRAQRQAREERRRQLHKWVIEGEAGAVPALPDRGKQEREADRPERWQVLIVSADGWGQEENADSLLRFAVQNMLEDLLPGSAVLIHQGQIVGVTDDSSWGDAHFTAGRFKGMLERIENLLNCRLRLAAGIAVEEADQVHQSYLTAAAAFAYHDLLPGVKLLDYREVAERKGGRTVLSQEEENGLGSILLEQDPMALRAWTHRLADELAADPECTPESYQACLQSAAVAAHRWLERTLRALGKEGAARFEPWQQPIEGAKLKEELFRHLHAVMTLYHNQLGEGQASHVQRAKAYMESCPAEELSLQQVAAYVHLHPGHLSELFKKETGSTFGDYVIALRMRRAMELLAVSPAKVSEIAGLTGYEDVKYFSRLFKKHTGKTPSEFRDEALGYDPAGLTAGGG
ncbi:response regulator transcription factor [Paenibacillus rubinfantis]|uniref:response regulator transcription factor n=1 Tax=Paenibacillus rubinfantis TaxID=1720296 RepID=UPI00073F08CA|nr:helix-turn-helix domain-containing protein [Paenibacillus rubinfantis]